MTGASRVGKLIALASEINDVEIDAGSLAFMGQALVQTTLPHSDPGNLCWRHIGSADRAKKPVR